MDEGKDGCRGGSLGFLQELCSSWLDQTLCRHNWKNVPSRLLKKHKCFWNWLMDGYLRCQSYLMLYYSPFNALFCPFMPLVPFPESLSHLYKLMAKKQWLGKEQDNNVWILRCICSKYIPTIPRNAEENCAWSLLFSTARHPANRSVHHPTVHKSNISKLSKAPCFSCRNYSEYVLRDKQTAAWQTALMTQPW